MRTDGREIGGRERNENEQSREHRRSLCAASSAICWAFSTVSHRPAPVVFGVPSPLYRIVRKPGLTSHSLRRPNIRPAESWTPHILL
jgi:hypothetical protein